MSSVDSRKRIYLLLLIASFGIALFCLVYPIYVIRPFRHQGVQELSFALIVLRYRWLVTTLCAVAALAVLVPFWRALTRPSRRISAAILALGVVLFAALTHVNVYELMFHPIGAPTFEPVAQTKLDGGEMILAVRQQGVARAYPIRSISYHHIVNDTLGAVPIVATY